MQSAKAIAKLASNHLLARRVLRKLGAAGSGSSDWLSSLLRPAVETVKTVATSAGKAARPTIRAPATAPDPDAALTGLETIYKHVWPPAVRPATASATATATASGAGAGEIVDGSGTGAPPVTEPDVAGVDTPRNGTLGDVVFDNLRKDRAEYQATANTALSLRNDSVGDMINTYKKEHTGAFNRMRAYLQKLPENKDRSLTDAEVWTAAQHMDYKDTVGDLSDALDRLAGAESGSADYGELVQRVEGDVADLYARSFRLQAHLRNELKENPGAKNTPIYQQLDSLSKQAIEDARDVLGVLGSEGWDKDKWKKFREDVANRMTPGGAAVVGGGSFPVTDTTRKQIVDELTKNIGERAGSKVENTLAAVDEQAKKDFDWDGLGDWFTANWRNFLVPASVLLTLFGGSSGRILGVLGMLGGAYDLYNRYTNLTGDSTSNPRAKHVQGALAHAVEVAGELRESGENPKANPFDPNLIEAQVNDYISRLPQGEQQQAMGLRDEMIQGIRDMGLLTRVGFHQVLKDKIRAQGDQALQAAWGSGPAAGQAVA